MSELEMTNGNKSGSKGESWSFRVLAAEDCPDTQLILRVRLGEIATELACTENGEQCVEVARRAWANGEPFDLLLIDLLMPKMDGFATARALRSRGYTWPIAIMSARELGNDRQLASESGCDLYLSKSFLQNRFYRPDRRSFDLLSPGEPASPPLVKAETELVRAFVASMPQTLSRLQDALENKDWDRLELFAVRLKPSLLFGYPKLSQLGQSLQNAARRHSFDASQRACDEIRACFELVQASV